MRNANISARISFQNSKNACVQLQNRMLSLKTHVINKKKMLNSENTFVTWLSECECNFCNWTKCRHFHYASNRMQFARFQMQFKLFFRLLFLCQCQLLHMKISLHFTSLDVCTPQNSNSKSPFGKNVSNSFSSICIPIFSEFELI